MLLSQPPVVPVPPAIPNCCPGPGTPSPTPPTPFVIPANPYWHQLRGPAQLRVGARVTFYASEAPTGAELCYQHGTSSKKCVYDEYDFWELRIQRGSTQYLTLRRHGKTVDRLVYRTSTRRGPSRADPTRGGADARRSPGTTSLTPALSAIPAARARPRSAVTILPARASTAATNARGPSRHDPLRTVPAQHPRPADAVSHNCVIETGGRRWLRADSVEAERFSVSATSQRRDSREVDCGVQGLSSFSCRGEDR
jgi:hypothetical protein